MQTVGSVRNNVNVFPLPFIKAVVSVCLTRTNYMALLYSAKVYVESYQDLRLHTLKYDT